MMNPIRTPLATVAVCSLLFSASAGLAAPKDYQFTGPVTAMTDATFTVQKGKEFWEFAKDTSTKTPADLKVGDKVTVHYVMTATTVDTAPAAKEKGTKKDKAEAAPAASAKP